MSETCLCNLPLNQSVAFSANDAYFKSCPKCSESAGTHIFYPASSFGRRNCNGVDRIQSWCPGCRSKNRPYLAQSYTCQTLFHAGKLNQAKAG